MGHGWNYCHALPSVNGFIVRFTLEFTVCDSLRAAIQGSLEKGEWNYRLSIAVYSSEGQIQ